MRKTLFLSFALKNTYRVNSILYSLKQIPLLGRAMPQELYRVHGLKIFANVLSAVWEVLSAFLGKFVYFFTMIGGMGLLYPSAAPDRVFLHLILCLTAAGAVVNTYLFNPSRDKYYAMMLLGMDARAYTLGNYGYSLLKVVVGFLPFAVLFGQDRGVPLWLCLLIPPFVAGAKATVAALSLWTYEKKRRTTNENRLDGLVWAGVGVLLLAAYGLPAIGLTLPVPAAAGVMGVVIATGAASLWKLVTFSHYREMYQQILSQSIHQMDAPKQAVQTQSRSAISDSCQITSRRAGFEYLNELFVKRHRKILWKSARLFALIGACVVAGTLVLFAFVPQAKESTNSMMLTYLPYFVFIMYAINRGPGFTQALFINCDHSLLTYPFYKEPKMILKLFQLRLRELIKINLLPASVVGGGMALLLYASGGTDQPLSYGVLVVSILAMSVFFSVHYLTIYYLLQPYNAGTELKSGTYRMVLTVTYLVCFFCMQLRMPTMMFGLMTIVFCLLYCFAACVLVYRLAPKTFRIRS